MHTCCLCTSCGVADTRWSDWQMWSQCSNSCGSGTRKRVRVCEYSSTANTGHSCFGSELEYEACFVKHCPGKFFFSFFLYLPSNRYKSVQTEYKSGQDRKAARAALTTTLKVALRQTAPFISFCQSMHNKIC